MSYFTLTYWPDKSASGVAGLLPGFIAIAFHCTISHAVQRLLLAAGMHFICVILGGTEPPLLDTTRLHVERAVRELL